MTSLQLKIMLDFVELTSINCDPLIVNTMLCSLETTEEFKQWPCSQISYTAAGQMRQSKTHKSHVEPLMSPETQRN